MGKLREYAGCAVALGPTMAARARIFWMLTKNARVRARVARHHPRHVYRLDTVLGPLHLRDNFGDVTNLVGVLYRNAYAARPLEQDGAVLDVGANIGLAARAFAARNPGRRIVSIEPLAENVRLIALNCPDAVVVQAAAAAENGTASLAVDPDGVIASSIPCAWQTVERVVPARTVDDVCREFAVDRVAVLKIDAEGMEPAILKGAHATLDRTAEVVLETHGVEGHERCAALLRDSGFTIVVDRRDGATGFLTAQRPGSSR